jgi:hypothetical protein
MRRGLSEALSHGRQNREEAKIEKGAACASPPPFILPLRHRLAELPVLLYLT